MKTRFLEVEDHAKTNHGKFLVMQLGADELKYRSRINPGPLLASLPPTRRFGGKLLSAQDLLLVDLQTQEGFFFDPSVDDEGLRRRFLIHPLHVCLLFFPAMRVLTRAFQEHQLWKLPGLVAVDLADVLNQPGLLVDATGRPVRGVFEWSARRPLSVRMRNREVVDGADPELGQGELTPDEQASTTERPTW